MALSPYKTFVAGEILTAADLNASFSQITANALQLISPLTGTLDADGKTIILDADADSNLAAGTDDILTLTLQSFAAFIWDGDVATPVNGITFRSAATATRPAIVAHGGDTNIDLLLQGKGTGKVALGSVPLLWPNADGTAGQYLITDGSGALSFASISVTFAPGDRLAFQQTTPGGSFVKDTLITSDSALRLTTGSVTNDLTGAAFTTTFAATRNTGNESAGHTHSVSVSGNATANNTWSQASGSDGSNGRYWVQSATPTFAFSSSVTSGGISANHTHATDMKVDYYDFTIGEAA